MRNLAETAHLCAALDSAVLNSSWAWAETDEATLKSFLSEGRVMGLYGARRVRRWDIRIDRDSLSFGDLGIHCSLHQCVVHSGGISGTIDWWLRHSEG